MPHIILFDSENREHLLPLTYTRPMSELRVGILTISEKWRKTTGWKVSYITQDYLAGKYPIEYGKENYIVDGGVLPSDQLLRLMKEMESGDALLEDDQLIAAKLSEEQLDNLVNDEDIGQLNGKEIAGTDFVRITRLWELTGNNKRAIEDDFSLLTKGRASAPISATNTIIGDASRVFLEEGARMECAIVNVEDGPLYIGRNAKVLEGAMLRGGVVLGDEAVVKMGAKIYGPTTIGPVSKIGGEVSASIIWGYSNKGHDGYLGDSVIGKWCNLGADTNVSNLKNNYEEVKLWSYADKRFVKTGTQFCGVIMGDQSKCGINTMINTGTVIGVCVNLFGSGYPRNYIPSYSWGGASGFKTYRIEKAFDTIERVMDRRNVDFDTDDRIIMIRVFEDTIKNRPWK